MILASAIITRVSDILQDQGNVRWTEDELLRWLNDAQANIVILKPEAGAKNVSVSLVPGAKQTLPNDGVQLIDIPRNMGATGSDAGNAIRVAAREDMDAHSPGWMTATPAGTVLNFVHNKLDPLHFYVYPPQPDPATFVEMVYAAIPSEVLSVSDPLSLPDIYATAVVDYIVHRAYQKDAEDQSNASRSMAHLTSFLNTLGVQAKNVINPAAVTFPLAPGGTANG